MAIKRTPDEIMSVFDQAQDRLGPDFDMRSLLWEVLHDVLNSISLAETASENVTVYDTVYDYVANNYGDDE